MSLAQMKGEGVRTKSAMRRGAAKDRAEGERRWLSTHPRAILSPVRNVIILMFSQSPLWAPSSTDLPPSPTQILSLYTLGMFRPLQTAHISPATKPCLLPTSSTKATPPPLVLIGSEQRFFHLTCSIPGSHHTRPRAPSSPQLHPQFSRTVERAPTVRRAPTLSPPCSRSHRPWQMVSCCGICWLERLSECGSVGRRDKTTDSRARWREL